MKLKQEYSKLSTVICQLTKQTEKLLKCSISTSLDKWNEIRDIVTGRHYHDVTA